MAAVSKVEFLKRYMSSSTDEDKKKKRKKKPKVPQKFARSVIVDDDVHWTDLTPKGDEAKAKETEFDDAGDEAPVLYDEDGVETISMDRFKKREDDLKSKWAPINVETLKGSDSKDLQKDVSQEIPYPERVGSPVTRTRADTPDNSPPRRRRADTPDNSPPRKRTDTPDNSPPRRRRADTPDNSPPRRRAGTPDNSLPRRRRADIPDNSPPRPRRADIPDNSPPRRRRADTPDNSPPRRRRADILDNLPPRRRRADTLDNSPSRRRADTPDNSPPRRRRTDILDNSPPIRRRADTPDDSPPRRRADTPDNSPPRKRKADTPDKSPRRRRRRGDTPDNSPPRRKTDISCNKEHMDSALQDKKAGLLSAEDLKRENALTRKREAELFANMDASISGRGTKTVHRDKSGRKRDLEAEDRKKKEEEMQKAKDNEKFKEWGRGVAQTKAAQDKFEDFLHEASKPLARYKDDKDLDAMLKDQEREDDPMLAYMQKKKVTANKKAGVKVKPTYKGPAPQPNRFGIQPGYRWDGVDRSNGFEKKRFTMLANKKAVDSIAHKWSIEDM